MSRKKVVLLVDNKKRDLMVSALIAHHLQQRGIQCYLEPLEAYRAVLAAYKPDMIVFNHLTASHLVSYANRLARLGVLTAVLPNEGILYNQEVLRYNAGRYHSGAHIDYFFCWNEMHKKALIASGFEQNTHIEVVGVPRFDFYFQPWSAIFTRQRTLPLERPKILFCTNFVFAKFYELPRERADRFFAPWKDRISTYKNYWEAIEISYNARKKFFAFLEAVVYSNQFDVTLRPHPSEDAVVYNKWYEKLPAQIQKQIVIDQESNITGLILACDLEISCETCTTALESWIAKKPTIELTFYRHPMFFHAHVAALNVLCDNPAEITDLITAQLASPAQKEFEAGRQRHLAEWCHAPSGDSAYKIAQVIAEALCDNRRRGWQELQWSDYRRGVKLQALQRLGLPYNYTPFLRLQKWFVPAKYRTKSFIRDKTITPRDVAHSQALLQKSLNQG